MKFAQKPTFSRLARDYDYGANKLVTVVYHFCMENRLSKKIFSDLVPKERSGGESHKSGFGFDLKNPPGVWIFWIHDPFLDFIEKPQNPFLDSEIRI